MRLKVVLEQIGKGDIEMDETSFVRCIIRAITLILVSIIVTIGGCNMHIDYRIAKAIESGNDPIITSIAFASAGNGFDKLVYILKNVDTKK